MSEEPTWENAPERVFMDTDMKFSEWDKQYAYDVEYIRADIHEARIKELENKLAKALGALQAFKDFDDLPLEWKRPDVFEIEVRKPTLRTLAEMQHKGGEK